MFLQVTNSTALHLSLQFNGAEQNLALGVVPQRLSTRQVRYQKLSVQCPPPNIYNYPSSAARDALFGIQRVSLIGVMSIAAATKCTV